MSYRMTAIAVALASALAIAPQAGLAQTGGTTDPQADQQSFELTEQKLDAFIVAALEIIKIREVWSPQIEGAASDAEAESMIDRARGEMEAAVEGTPGITPGEYMGIARAAQQNPDLAQAIEMRIRAAQQSAQ